MAWSEFALAVVAGAAIVGGSGAAVLASLRFRGLWLAAGAPAVGVTLVSITAVVCDLVSVPFSVLPLVAVTIVAAAAGWLFARGTRPRVSVGRSRKTRRWTALAVASGIALLAARMLFAIGDPQNFAQVGDNVFHLNAVQWILDHHDASPISFGSFGDSINVMAFYPTAWHAITALIAQATGASVVVSSTATLFVFACVAWPFAGVLLARSLFGRSAPVLLAAGALAAGFAAYPFELIPYMGTFPFVASIPTVAIALAAAWNLLGVGRSRLPRAAAAVLFASTLPGIAVLNSRALVMLAVLALPAVAAAAARVARRRPAQRRLAWLGFALASATVLALIALVRPDFLQEGSWRGTVAQSIGEYILVSWSGRPASIVIAVLVGLGIVRALMRRAPSDWVAVATWAAVGVVYVAAAGNDEFFRIVVAGPWYADATRIAAFAPIAALPLAAHGAHHLWSLVRRIDRLGPAKRRPRVWAIGGTIAVVLLAVVVVADPAVRAADRSMGTTYQPTDDPFLSRVGVGPDEHAVFEQVREIVPRTDVVAGSPYDGSSFAYALTGRPAMVAHLLARLTPAERDFLDGIGTAAPGEPACEAARELNVKWILEFHPDKLLPTVPRYAGLQDLDDSANVELAFRSGTSSLYRLTGCGLG